MSRRTAWMVRLLLVCQVVWFYVEFRQGGAIQAFIYRFGVVPANWLMTHPADLLDWPQLFLTLLSSQFLHGGLLHLGVNMLYLWMFGDHVEDRLGPGRFLVLYLGSGVVAALAHILVSPTSSIPMVGASGSIAGILGAYLLLFPAARIVTVVPRGFSVSPAPPRPNVLGRDPHSRGRHPWGGMKTVEVPVFVFLGLWFLLQWFNGLTTIGHVADVGGVAFWAHIGGLMSGMVGVIVLRSSSG